MIISDIIEYDNRHHRALSRKRQGEHVSNSEHNAPTPWFKYLGVGAI